MKHVAYLARVLMVTAIPFAFWITGYALGARDHILLIESLTILDCFLIAYLSIEY